MGRGWLKWTTRFINSEISNCNQVKHCPVHFSAYKTYGQLNAAGDNVVVLPTFYTGSHYRNEGFFGTGRGIDPAKHFVVSINMFGNSLSSSPSNTPAPFDGPSFPTITLWDNIAAQHELLTEVLSVQSIALVAGWSMAGLSVLSVGGAVPRYGESNTAVLCFGKNIAAQHRVSRRRQSGAAGRRKPGMAETMLRNQYRGYARLDVSMPAGRFRKRFTATVCINNWVTKPSTICSTTGRGSRRELGCE